jgi:hypothetical protein
MSLRGSGAKVAASQHQEVSMMEPKKHPMRMSARYIPLAALALCLLLITGGGASKASGTETFRSSKLEGLTKHQVVVGNLPTASKPGGPNVVQVPAIETDLTTLERELQFDLRQPKSLLGEFELVKASKSLFAFEGPRANLYYASRAGGSAEAFTVTQSKPGVTSVISVSPDRVIREVEINGARGVLYDMYDYLPDPKPLREFEPYLAILTWTDGSRLFEVWGKDHDLMIKVALALE